MPSRSLKDLHPDVNKMALAFLDAVKARGLDVLVTCTFRSPYEQNALYAQGRTHSGPIVTWAKGGESPHNVEYPDKRPCSMAFDFVPMYNGKCVWDDKDPLWQTYIKIGKDVGLESGADFLDGKKDMPHFQLKNWKVVRRSCGFI